MRAVFGLIGIAGEDDLDAPDLNAAEPYAPGEDRLAETGFSVKS